MVDYSKWKDLDSGDSDSESDAIGGISTAIARKKGALVPTVRGSSNLGNGDGTVATKRDDDKTRLLEQVERLRLQGNAAFEGGDLPSAMAAYEAQLALVEGNRGADAQQAMCAALLNQSSALIRMRKFAEAERRCTRLLGATDGTDPGSRSFRTRALHFRGFSRLRQLKHKEAVEDLRGALAAGSGQSDEARALLMEAEAGAALSGCDDPEAMARDLLRAGDCREAAKHFREAASRARRRIGRRAGDDSTSALARNLRMEGIAVARAGDSSSAENLLRGGLKAVRALASREGGRSRPRLEVEGEGMMQAALGGLLAQEGKHEEAIVFLRAAAVLLEGALKATNVSAEGGSDKYNGTTSSSGTGSGSGSAAGLEESCFVVLASLGASLLSLENVRKGVAAGGDAPPAAVTALVPATPCPPSATGTVGETPKRSGSETKEAIVALERALGVLNPVASPAASGSCDGDLVNSEGDEEAGADGVPASQEGMMGGGASRSRVENAKNDGAGGELEAPDRAKKTARMARVLDTLSEAHARAGHWEQARSTAERSLTAWRSLGDRGKTGAAASLLSLGHLTLQLHGIGAGLGEASARWEEAASCLDACAQPSDAAEVRLRVSGFYSKVARSDPSLLPSLEAKIARHFWEAARLLGRQRAEQQEERTSSQRPGPSPPPPPLAVTPGEGEEGPGGILPPADRSGLGSGLESDAPERPSLWELAEKEASAWEGFAGAVDDHEEAATALRKAERLLDEASVSQRDEAWTLRQVTVLQNLALALARGGDHRAAEDRLLTAISALRELDDGDQRHKGSLIELHKYLGVARRARGDLPGAKEALQAIADLGGNKGHDEIEDLNHMLGRHRIAVD